MSDQLLAAPVAAPIHLLEARAHLRVVTSDEDALIQALVAAAAGHVESWCRRALLRQQRLLTLDCFRGGIAIPRSPLRAVQSIQYLDTAGALQTFPAASYRVDKASDRPRIVPAYGEVWPVTLAVINAVTVRYTAGFAVPIDGFDVPADTIAARGHDLAADEIVQLSNSGGVLQSPLSALANYYVKGPTADALQLAAGAGGAAIDLTAATPNTGQSFLGAIPFEIKAALLLIVGHLFEHREAISDFEKFEVPLAADALLAPWRVLRF